MRRGGRVGRPFFRLLDFFAPELSAGYGPACTIPVFPGGRMKTNKLFLSVVCLLLFGTVADIAAQTRIRFARGRTSATVAGQIGGGATRTYVLGARAGQVFSGNISSRSGCVRFTEGATSSSFVTERGDNLVSITNSCRRMTSFTMTVSINYGSD